MKRFYKDADIYIAGESYGVALDGKPVKTPAGSALLWRNKKLAQQCAEEWRAQEKEILPQTMPINQIVITTLDGTRPRQDIENHILSYIDTDLLFYRSDASPYSERQQETWGRWTDWLDQNYKVSSQITREISPLTQAPEIFSLFKSYISNLDLIELTLFDSLVEDTSSCVLTLAFFERAATVDDAYNAVFADDLVRAAIYDEERYGAAPDQEKKRKSVRHHLEAARKILDALHAAE